MASTPTLKPLPSSAHKGKGLYRGHLTVISNSITQMVNMHMEKVARREIGTLATVQRLPPGQKIIAPESLPPLTPYYRKPLNFGCLDDIGHGIKVEKGAPPLSPQPLPLPHGSLLSRPPVLFHIHVRAPTCSPFLSSLPETIALSDPLTPQVFLTGGALSSTFKSFHDPSLQNWPLPCTQMIC